MDTTIKQTRRRVLGTIAGGGLVGLAGCSGDAESLTVAYMPIFPDLQYFIMRERDLLPAGIVGQEFTDGPAIVQAFASGDIDIAMFGVVPAMILIDRGIPAKVTAANIKEPMAILTHEEFGPMFETQGAAAFDAWEADRGRAFRFGTFPQGSVPDVLLRYWLTEGVGIAPSEVEIIELNGVNAVYAALASGEIDGTSIMDPVPSRVTADNLPYQILRTAAEVMPGQPAAVTLMSDAVRGAPIGEGFIGAHIAATEYINQEPSATAGIIESALGMPVETATAALAGPLANFISDPRAIVEGTEVFAEVTAASGRIEAPLTTADIFDFGLYDAQQG
jgi:NitT/TauT family transport system substrate-binding protein